MLRKATNIIQIGKINNNFYLNLSLFNNLVTISSLYWILNIFKFLIIFKNNIKFKIIKNEKKFLPLFRQFNYFIKNNKFFFKKKFKLKKFYFFIKKNKKMKKKFYKNSPFLFLHSYYSQNRLNYSKNWFFLKGNLISPYYSEFKDQKKWLQKNLKQYLKKNSKFKLKKNYVHKKLNKFINFDFKNKTLLKQLYYNEFFYFKKLNMNFSELKYKLNLPFLKNTPRSKNWLTGKPYLFLNNKTHFSKNNNYINKNTIKYYRSYFKMFKIIKKNYKNHTKKKKITRVFKKVSYSKLHIFFKSKVNFKINKTIRFLKNPNTNIRLYSKKNFVLKKSNFRVPKILINKFIFKLFLKRTYNYRKFKILKVNLKFIKSYNKTIVSNFFFKYLLKKNNNSLKKVKKKNLFFFLKKIFKLKKKLIIKKSRKNFKKKITNKKLRKLFLISIIKFKKKFKNRFKKIVYSLNFNNFKKNKKMRISFIIKNKKANNLFLKLNFFLINNFLNKKKKFNNMSNKKTFPNVYYFFNKTVIYNKYLSKFLTNFNGFFFLTNAIFLNYFSHKVKKSYQIRKQLNTFSNKNELQKYILKKYIKRRTITFLNNKFLCEKPLPKKSIELGIHNISNLFSYDENLFDNFKALNNFFLFFSTFYPTRKRYDHNDALSRLNIIKREKFSPLIKKVKFKPGYMTMWRKARTILKEVLFLKFRYQQKLTSYLYKYDRFLRHKFYLVLEMRFINVLLKSRLLNDKNNIYLFLNNSLIYLNGSICKDPNIQIYVNDFIQFVISLKFYILNRWMASWSIKKQIRLKKKARYKVVSKKRIYGDEKKKSYLLPNWILFNRNITEDVIKFLEVDFYTLSAFVLYEPFLWTDIDTYTYVSTRYSVLNMYNWKYIN